VEGLVDWRALGSTFVLIFLAELGDKTQLATFGMASGARSRLAVFLGAAGALVATSALAVVFGDAVGRYVPQLWLRRASGVLFLALGLLFLIAPADE
jgi:putative Ca2+/H+ antiporter (TMEM165/GDT1 family)